jgi:hypothetical protein
MLAFTYFFVSALPEASPDTTLAGGGPTTTTGPGEGSTTSSPGNEGTGGGNVDAATQEYLDALDSINDELQVMSTDLVSTNDGFDADPREIEYDDAVARFTSISEDTQDLADQVGALTVPAGLEDNQTSLVTAIDGCASAASEALEGLTSSNPGDLRRAAVAAYAQSAEDFDTEVQNAHSAA